MGKRAQTTYDAVASEYAEHFKNELDGKPLDRELLQRFAEQVKGQGAVLEVGCGPGQIGDYIRQLGATVYGSDLSYASLAAGRSLYGQVPCVQSDMLALCVADESVDGILAFYAIVHLSNTELDAAVREMYRALQPGGTTFLSFHIGEDTRHIDEFLGKQVDIEFQFFRTERVVTSLEQAGFHGIEPVEREPYPDAEHPSRRAYVFATKPA
jgi:SAM-dependent methyltransferase